MHKCLYLNDHADNQARGLNLVLSLHLHPYFVYASSGGSGKSAPLLLADAIRFLLSIFRGMTVTSGSVTLTKDEKNLIGISIGGGAPLCPCLYVVQVRHQLQVL